MVPKNTKNLVTYRAPGTEGWEDLHTNNYEQLDYINISQPWRNSVTDTSTDPNAGIYSDHLPLVATLKVKYATKERKTKTPRYDFTRDEERDAQLNKSSRKNTQKKAKRSEGT